MIFDSATKQYREATAAEVAAAQTVIDRSNAVNAWLVAQAPKKGATEADLAAWGNLRRLPFEEQAKRAGL